MRSSGWIRLCCRGGNTPPPDRPAEWVMIMEQSPAFRSLPASTVDPSRNIILVGKNAQKHVLLHFFLAISTPISMTKWNSVYSNDFYFGLFHWLKLSFFFNSIFYFYVQFSSKGYFLWRYNRFGIFRNLHESCWLSISFVDSPWFSLTLPSFLSFLSYLFIVFFEFIEFFFSIFS